MMVFRCLTGCCFLGKNGITTCIPAFRRRGYLREHAQAEQPKHQNTSLICERTHEDAFTGCSITFYNGSFTAQTVAPGTRLTGKDGVTILTSQAASIPPATPATPPTYAAVSVTAFSSIAGTVGNIPASDIDQACCGVSILAQNLYPFSGGSNSRDVTIVTKGDIANTTATIKTALDQETTDQAQNEVQPGQELLPLSCTISFISFYRYYRFLGGDNLHENENFDNGRSYAQRSVQDGKQHVFV
jgi:hypothetical protein